VIRDQKQAALGEAVSVLAEAV